ncbi:universal stress protein [Glycomyces albidus]|jgi:nucleotide-binding universal stress UspA family protein|uniref:Universal stress protein n=1 Tax=Glycomyces albidus TaxID=2656774 RepID=A0A6L5G9D3_9ACTN|nr:universal stress protein [Glycomyces albidus]MQM26178.1 universal stress protein [Glycomyces albidus]
MTDINHSEGRLVVGVDGSASSNRALAWALAYAEELHLEVTAVHAWQYPYAYGSGATVPAAGDVAAAARRVLDDAVSKAAAEHPSVRVNRHLAEGHPARVLIEQSEDAHMLIVGSRGHGAFVGALIGSVSQYCVSHARCPVLVVREAD